jgi:hypothetical protein
MAARWSIVNNHPENVYQRNGDILYGRRITIREESTGWEDEFWIADSQATPDNIIAEGQQRADRLHGTSQLGNT